MFKQKKFSPLSKACHLSYRSINKEQFEGHPASRLAVNISGGGMSFETVEALPTNSMVALEIGVDDFCTPILALAKVAWCKAKANLYEIGAEFWWIGWSDQQAQATVADYITTELLDKESQYASTG